MKYYPTQLFDQRPVSLWQLCVLLLLLKSLAFNGWLSLQPATNVSNSGFVTDLNQITFANHHDHFRTLLDIKKPSAPNSNDADAEPHWLAKPVGLNFPFAALLVAANLHYLTLLIIDDSHYHLPLSRAPPQ